MKSIHKTLKSTVQQAGGDARRASKLVRKGPSPMALEQRFMFDGAAVDTAVALTAAIPEATVQEAPDLMHFVAAEVPQALLTSQQEVQRQVSELLAQPEAREQLFALFNGGKDVPSADWNAQLDAFMQAVQSGEFNIEVQLLSGDTLQGAKAAFAAEGPDGAPVIYLNTDWLNGGVDTASLNRVLTEELGHAIDHYINGQSDSAGDEGEAFSHLLATGQLRLNPVDCLADAGVITVEGQNLSVEFANFTFVNAYEMVYDLNNNNLIEGNLGETDAAPEQSSHNFNANDPLGQVSVNDGSGERLFSGNNVSAASIIVGGENLFGWISRPIKSGGVVRGFYFWTDRDFGSLSAAQLSGDADGDRTAADNRGFVLVVDQAWFDQQIALGAARSINNTIDGNLGSINVANVGSSSDRVDAALNSLLAPNSVQAVADTLTVNEDSLATTGNLLANDSDPNGDSFTVTSFSVGGLSGPFALGEPTTITGVGTFSLTADGVYSFTPVPNYNGPVPAITYTVTDAWGASSSATLSISVAAVNDVPVALHDSQTVTEDTPATGNVLANDSDIDGDILVVATFEVNGMTYTAGQTATLAGVGTFTLGANGVYVFTPAANYVGVVPLITYSVADGQGGTASATLALTMAAVNDAPVASPDSGTATDAHCANGVGSPAVDASGQVMRNDSDPDGAVNPGVTHLVTAVVSEGGNLLDAATRQVVGRYGTLTIQADGNYRYVVDGSNAAVQALAQGESLSEVFTYTLTEATGASPLSTISALTITVQGGNDAPVAQDDYDSVQEAGSSSPYGTATGNVKSNDSDVDSTFAVTQIDGLTTFVTSGWPPALNSKSATDFNSVSVAYTPPGGTQSTFTFLQSDGVNVLVSSLVASGQAINLQFSDPQPLLDYVAAHPGTVITVRLTEAGGTNTYDGTYGSASADSDPVTSTTAGVVAGRYGTLTLSADGSYRYDLTNNTLNSGQSYTESFEYTITDAQGCSTTATLFIRVDGSNTVLADLAAVVLEDSGNYVSGASSIGRTDIASFTWAGQTAAAGTTITDPSLGTLGINSDGTYTFDPVDNYTGPVPAATFVINDGASAQLQLTIQAVNDAPIAADDTKTVTEDTPASGTVLANDSDVDGDLLAVKDFTVNGVTYNAGATATLTGVGTLTLAADGGYAFTPALDFTGAVPVFTYTVDDGNGGTDTATLTLTMAPVNDPPVNTVPLAQTVDSYATDNAITGLSVEDVDGNLQSVQLTVAYGTLGFSGSPLTGFSGSGTLSDPLVLTGTEAQINALLAQLTYTPDTLYAGSDKLTIRSTDATGLTDTDFVNITVSPDARPLTVTGSVVNEASPFVLFQVDGEPGQWVTLALGTTGSGTGHATPGADHLPNLEYFDGQDWKAYQGGYVQIPDVSNAAGLLLVRTAVLQDSVWETTSANYETLKLTATNQAGGSDDDVSQIRDDGLGAVFLVGNESFTPDDPTDPAYSGPQLDDDRPLRVSNLVVNEGSPYAVFTVTGAPDQLATLTLTQNGDGSYLSALQYYDPTNPAADDKGWVDYAAGSLVSLDSGGSLLVRVAISPEQETALDGPENFNLIATNTGGTASMGGVGTIKDDGTGTYYPDAKPNVDGTPATDDAAVLDDDRALSVSNVTVNEGSPYAVFTVTGAPSQNTTLSLANQNDDGSHLSALQYFNGTSWVGYTAGDGVSLNSSGSLLVRVALSPEQETVIDNGETFNLVATNNSGTVSTGGLGTIKDDGTGDYFAANDNYGVSTVPAGVVLDDDRALSVSDLTVNEGSPYAVFTVSGSAGQLASLALANGTTTGLTGLEVYNGTAWVAYTSGTVALDGSGKLLVRTALSPEQEAALDNGETFTLTATNTGGGSDVGTATVKDDGTGDYFAANDNDGVSTVPAGVVLDDDRALSVSDLTVNEGSPYAVFTVTGTANQLTTLALAAVTANPGTADGGDYGLIAAGSDLQVWDGDSWETYTTGNTVALNASGKLLVRVAITPDGIADNNETFQLIATNTGGKNFDGTATIRDDGTGTLFTDGAPTGDTPAVDADGPFDDDRPITVTGGVYNEASPRAVFTVYANPDQLITLDVRDAAEAGKAATGDNEGADGFDRDSLDNAQVYYSIDGGANWVLYTGTFHAGAVPVLVAVDISNEADVVFEGEEQLQLVVNDGLSDLPPSGVPTKKQEVQVEG